MNSSRFPSLRFLGSPLFAALLFLPGSMSLRAEASRLEGRTVRRIQFSGQVDIPESQLHTKIQTREGKEFSSEAANQDIKRLNNAGYFCKEYTVVPVEDGVMVVFYIEQNPTVDDIEFTGTVKKRHIKRFRELIQVRRGDLLRQHQINTDKQAMLLELKSKGFHFAKVTHEILPGPAGGKTVRFNVDTGKKVLIKNIIFKGATAFTKRKLRKLFKAKIDHWYNSGKYIEETFEEDVKRLREFYRFKGWLDAESSIESVVFTPNNKRVLLTVNVEEGNRYKVKAITFKGNELFTDDQLRSITELGKGGVYSIETRNADVKALRDKYGEKGYVRNEIRYTERVSREGNLISLAYDITEGEKAYVETINVLGNTRTKDIVIRREIDLIPGEEFNTVKLDDSIRRLKRTGFFEDVKTDYVPGSRPNLSTINIMVKEAKTGFFRIGAGFSSNSNFIGNISVTQKNFDYKDVPQSWHDFLSGNAFVGDGQSLTLQANPGNTVQQYRIAFTEPYLFDRPISFGLSGRFFERDRGDFDEARLGGTLSLGKRLLPDLLLRGIYRYEIVNLNNIDFDSVPQAVIDAQGDITVSSLGAQLSYDKRDDIFLPTAGHRSEIAYELASEAFGGDLNFQRITLSHSRHYAVYKTKDENKHVMSFQARTGAMDDYGGSRDIPLFEKFYLGGSNTVRGFQFRTLGPQDRDEPIGGKFFYQFNAEYRFPLYSNVFYGVVFNDIGNVTPTLGSSDLFKTWRASWGLGVRIRVPALGQVPIVFDFAFPWRKEPGDDTELFSFQFGAGF